MEYKIDDVAKLFETTNFTIYSYITKYPDLRKTLKAKSGVLTINEIGVDLLNKYMKDAKGIKDSKSSQPAAEEIFGEQHPDVTVKKKAPEPHIEQVIKPEAEIKPVVEAQQKEETPPSIETTSSDEASPLEETATTPEEKSKPYSDFSDFSVRVPPKAPTNDSGFNDVTYREMKEALLYLRDQLDKKDQQINDLSRMLENNQILLKQEQLNFKSLEEYLSKGRY
ncbi:hypothetical protein JR334_08710 [Clostridia bacterium]|nr:hypothetical protein JR334_08710 [Clostridia bacterium]